MSYKFDQAAFDALARDRLGRVGLTTDRDDWSTAEIIGAYHGQSKIEAVFAHLKDPFHLALWPQFSLDGLKAPRPRAHLHPRLRARLDGIPPRATARRALCQQGEPARCVGAGAPRHCRALCYRQGKDAHHHATRRDRFSLGAFPRRARRDTIVGLYASRTLTHYCQICWLLRIQIIGKLKLATEPEIARSLSTSA